jgi:N-acyl-D-amino-acid deacylase
MTIRVIFVSLVAIFAQAGRQPPPGLLIKNAQLIDGTGAAARRADVRVSGDTIAALGEKLPAQSGERVIDAAGKVLSPGFIDMHSHADRGIDEAPDASTQVMQGITTAVVGQDGGSELPIADFYERILRVKPAINYATAVGHGTVRKLVMGGDYKRAATPTEIETMKVLVDRGMQDGAIGLSSGLEYDPGFYSKTEELVALGSAVAKYGGSYMSHVRNENEGAFASWREAIEIGRRNNIPVEISHIKLGVKPVWGRAAERLKILEDARREGVKVMADWYPYTYWQSSMYVLIETRDFENRAAWEKGLDDIGGAQNVLITKARRDGDFGDDDFCHID